jgi:DNA-binding MarR family transcriptional regulator
MNVTSVSRPELLDRDGSDRDFRHMVYDLLTVCVRMQEVRDRLAAEMEVSGPQYRLLMAIFHLQDEIGGAGVGAVARQLHVSGPFVTAQANRLVVLGLVEKRPNPDDGRGVLLCLTGDGMQRIVQSLPVIQRANDAFFGSVDRLHFVALSDLAASLEKSSGQAVRMLKELSEPG